MGQFRLLARPLRVNLLLLIPLALYFAWRNRGIQVPGRQLLFGAIFAVSFGFVESAVAVDLSAGAGLLPDYTGKLSEVQSLAGATQLETLLIDRFPQSLPTVYGLRDSATIVMLVGVALLAAAKPGSRALFSCGHRPRPTVSHPRTLGCTGVVSFACECRQ